VAWSEERLDVGSLLVTAAWLLALAVLAPHQVLLFFAPALLLALPLALGRYPGEKLLGELRDHVAGRDSRKRALARVPMPRRRPVVSIPRGGALLAAGLATRPPPAPALT
jgi:hypothetical protein